MRAPHIKTSLRLRIARGVLRTLVPLVGVMLLVAGLMGILSFAVLPALKAFASRDWVEVAATVESVSLAPPPSPVHPPLSRLSVAYRYEYGGATQRGTRCDPHGGMTGWNRGIAQVDQYTASPAAMVWVNPADPAESMLHRDLRGPVLMFALPALGLALLGGIMVFAGMLSWNRVRLPWRRRPTAVADDRSTGPTGSV